MLSGTDGVAKLNLKDFKVQKDVRSGLLVLIRRPGSDHLCKPWNFVSIPLLLIRFV